MQNLRQSLLKWGAVALFVLCGILTLAVAKAEEQYLIVPLTELEQDGPEKLSVNDSWSNWGHTLVAHADNPGCQAYLSNNIPGKFSPRATNGLNDDTLSKRFANDLAGIDRDVVYLVARIDGQVPSQMKFRCTDLFSNPAIRDIQFIIDWNKLYSEDNDTFAKAVFLLCEQEHYSRNSRSSDHPGAPFFAHLARESQKKLNAEFGLTQPTDNQPAAPRVGGMSTRANQSLVRSFDLLSGCRAIEQNLELDAVLNAWKQEQRTVDIADITGITVAEIDWEPLVRDLPETKLDRLASYVPADQHIIVFPDFRTAHKFAKLTEQSGIPVLQFLNYRDTSSDKRTFQRYQRQLGLSLDGLSELLGPMLIDSIAITGGDLYFPTGTDITILFETKNARALLGLLMTKAQLQFTNEKKIIHDDGRDFVSYVNPERTVSAYFAIIDEHTIAVANSYTSLQRIIATRDKKNESLADLPEYRFFRDRYKVGDESESVYAFLSDATIRRWCSPQWRIAASRRLLHQAILGQLQAQYAAGIINGDTTEISISTTRLPGFNFSSTTTQLQETPAPASEPQRTVGVAGISNFSLGRSDPLTEMGLETVYSISASGAMSNKYGTYQFLTPIAEMNIEKVTQEERRAYDQWRDEYEGRWRRNFDPIGIRITLDDKTMASDVTVMPINVRTSREFAQTLGFSAGVQFSPDQSVYGVPLQFIISINIDSQQFMSGANLAQQMAGGVSLGWIGNHATVFFDDDPFWLELLEYMQTFGTSNLPIEFLFGDQFNINRLPVGIEVASNNPLRLAAFLTALRGMVEQSAPGLTQWEALQHRDVPYVKVSSRSDNSMGVPDNLAIYYSPANGRLLVTLSENTLKRHIDRRLDAKPDAQPAPWSGENMAVRLDERAVPVLDKLYMWEMPEKMTDSAWRNVPILEEYKRRFPDKDPVAVHEQLWGERLFCPNNGSYVWDETWQTFEPQLGELPTASPIANVKTADLGVTFENEGIRARVVLELK